MCYVLRHAPVRSSELYIAIEVALSNAEQAANALKLGASVHAAYCATLGHDSMLC